MTGGNIGVRRYWSLITGYRLLAVLCALALAAPSSICAVDPEPETLNPELSPVVLATIWGEAADWQDDVEIIAIVHVLRNRVMDPERRFGATAIAVVTQRRQFQAHGGRQFWRYLSGNMSAAESRKGVRLRGIVDRAGTLADVTGGALYFSHGDNAYFRRIGLSPTGVFGRVWTWTK